MIFESHLRKYANARARTGRSAARTCIGAIIALVLFMHVSPLSAQPVADRTATSCEGETQRLYDTLNVGRPVLVAMLSFDCWTFCNPDGPRVGSFAARNAGRVHVWAPMANLEVAGKIDATCDTMPAWKQRHGWTNIHAFIDEPGIWIREHQAHYIVIDPLLMEVRYRGNDFDAATATALSLVDARSGSEEFLGRGVATELDLR